MPGGRAMMQVMANRGKAVQYMFWAYNATSGVWNQLQAFSPAASFPWTPVTAGTPIP